MQAARCRGRTSIHQFIFYWLDRDVPGSLTGNFRDPDRRWPRMPSRPAELEVVFRPMLTTHFSSRQV